LQESFCFLQKPLPVIIPKLLIQKQKYVLLLKVVVTLEVLCGFRVPLQWFLHKQGRATRSLQKELSLKQTRVLKKALAMETVR